MPLTEDKGRLACRLLVARQRGSFVCGGLVFHRVEVMALFFRHGLAQKVKANGDRGFCLSFLLPLGCFIKYLVFLSHPQFGMVERYWKKTQ